MFVVPLERIDDEYIVRIPHDLVVQQDLHEGQILSLVIEPLSEYVQIDSRSAELIEGRWQLNEDAPAYSQYDPPES